MGFHLFVAQVAYQHSGFALFACVVLSELESFDKSIL